MRMRIYNNIYFDKRKLILNLKIILFPANMLTTSNSQCSVLTGAQIKYHGYLVNLIVFV